MGAMDDNNGDDKLWSYRDLHVQNYIGQTSVRS